MDRILQIIIVPLWISVQIALVLFLLGNIEIPIPSAITTAMTSLWEYLGYIDFIFPVDILADVVTATVQMYTTYFFALFVMFVIRMVNTSINGK